MGGQRLKDFLSSTCKLYACLYLHEELPVLVLLEPAELVQLELGGEILLQKPDVFHRGAEDRTLVLPHVTHLLVVAAMNTADFWMVTTCQRVLNGL